MHLFNTGSVLLLAPSFSPAQLNFKGWLKQPAPLTPSSPQVKGRPVQDVCLCSGQAPTNLLFANKLHLCSSMLAHINDCCYAQRSKDWIILFYFIYFFWGGGWYVSVNIVRGD